MYNAWIYQQSGVLPYRKNKTSMEVLLISSRKHKNWIIPKGIVEPGLTPENSAIKEAYEEAGISGVISGPSLGKYTVEKWGGICSVEVFPFQVELVYDQWPESEFRERLWCPASDAVRKVRSAELAVLIQSWQTANESSSC